MGAFPIPGTSITLQDPTFEQYASARDKPKALITLFEKSAVPFPCLQHDGSTTSLEKTFSQILNPSGSNTMYDVISLAVLAHAKRSLTAIVDYMNKERSLRTRNLSVDFIGFSHHTPLWHAINDGQLYTSGWLYIRISTEFPLSNRSASKGGTRFQLLHGTTMQFTRIACTVSQLWAAFL
jgi:hypothetical protein